MSNEHKQRVRQVFMEVADLPPSEQGAALDRECRGDAALRAEVEALLRAEAQAGGFMASPTLADHPSRAHTLRYDQPGGHMSAGGQPPTEGAGTKIGPYKILQLIGEGGFGSVFMAQQEQPVQRKVALKIIKLGMDTRQVVARFEQERQALAIMDHAGIARVYDAGATETGRPYFVMELVKGDPIVEYCDRHNLNIRDRLELFAQVCAAVQHAHTKGVIHRDIKPSNILVTTQDGKPHAKVIDFGIAKATASRLTEKTLFTEHRQLIGTPEYMSPEQAEGSLDIDTRTDVYSLGVLLYELLTGTTPFSSSDLRSAAYAEIQRIIREVDPPNPSTRLSQNTVTLASVAAQRQIEPRKLNTLIRGELDWIVMKALEKDRQRRYETANGLAMDIQRYLSGEPVIAAPPSAGYHLRKFIKRHRTLVTAGSMVAATLVVGVVAFAWQAKVAIKQRDRAVIAETQTKKRAEELAAVAGFQASMLRQIDVTEAGSRLIADIRARYVNSLEAGGVAEHDRAPRNEAFGRELVRINATDAAVAMIDQTILRPAIDAIDAKFKDQPTVDASLRNTLAELYGSLGLYGQARTQIDAALATRRRVLGEEHPDTLTSLNNLANTLENLGKFEEAQPLYAKALEARRRVLGENHVDTLMSKGNLGNLLRSTGKLNEAEPLLRESLAGYRQVLGDHERDTMIAMNMLGFLLINQGKYDQAEPLWKEAYENGRKAFGDDDRDVLVWMNNLAGLLGVMNRSSEAEPIFRESLARHARVLGEEHPNSIRAIGAMGGHFLKRGMLAEAEPFVRDAMEKSRRAFGEEHPHTLQASTDLGDLLKQKGDFAGAELILSDVLAAHRRVFGSDHPDTLIALSNVARVHVEQRKLAEAAAEFREAWNTSRRVLGDEHPDTLVQKVNLANALLEQNELAEAEVLFREVWEVRQRVSGEEHRETLVAQSNLARVLQQQGRLPEAEASFRELVPRFQRAMGNDHPNTVNSITNLAWALDDQAKSAEAEPLFREGVAGNELRFGKNHVRTARARLGLGKSLSALARYSEAEAELTETQRIYDTVQAAPPDRRRETLEALVALYEAWDKAEPGKGHDAQAAAWKAKLAP